MELCKPRLLKKAGWNFLVMVFFLFPRSVPADAGFFGTWVGDPVLSQLGYIQTTLTFKPDGTFTQKNDHKSFCGMRAVSPDCVYFWTIAEGTYVQSGSGLTLRIEKVTSIQLREGETKPISNDMGLRALQTENLSILVEPKKITLTNTKTRVSHSYMQEIQSDKKKVPRRR